MLPPDEPRIDMTRAARRYTGSRGAAFMHPSTLIRHVLKGVVGPDGRTVRLEAEKIGCRWFTSEAALARFAERLAGDADPAALPRTPTQRQRAADRAAAELERMGA